MASAMNTEEQTLGTITIRVTSSLTSLPTPPSPTLMLSCQAAQEMKDAAHRIHRQTTDQPLEQKQVTKKRSGRHLWRKRRDEDEVWKHKAMLKNGNNVAAAADDDDDYSRWFLMKKYVRVCSRWFSAARPEHRKNSVARGYILPI